MALSTRNPGPAFSFLSQSTLTDGLCTVVGSADNTCALPAGADPVTFLGVVKREDGTSAASGDMVDLIVSGIYPLVASAAISRGDKLAIAGTSGKVKTCAIGAGANSFVIGIAIEAAAADGERVSAMLCPHLMQGA